jgi:hypothetical protein
MLYCFRSIAANCSRRYAAVFNANPSQNSHESGIVGSSIAAISAVYIASISASVSGVVRGIGTGTVAHSGMVTFRRLLITSALAYFATSVSRSSPTKPPPLNLR